MRKTKVLVVAGLMAGLAASVATVAEEAGFDVEVTSPQCVETVSFDLSSIDLAQVELEEVAPYTVPSRPLYLGYSAQSAVEKGAYYQHVSADFIAQVGQGGAADYSALSRPKVYSF